MMSPTMIRPPIDHLNRTKQTGRGRPRAPPTRPRLQRRAPSPAPLRYCTRTQIMAQAAKVLTDPSRSIAALLHTYGRVHSYGLH
jgi:hypothetical protein